MTTSEKLTVKMYKLGLIKRTATAVMNMLKTEEQLQEIMDYIIKNEDIITDHQTIQHLAKMLYKDKN